MTVGNEFWVASCDKKAIMIRTNGLVQSAENVFVSAVPEDVGATGGEIARKEWFEQWHRFQNNPAI